MFIKKVFTACILMASIAGQALHNDIPTETTSSRNSWYDTLTAPKALVPLAALIAAVGIYGGYQRRQATQQKELTQKTINLLGQKKIERAQKLQPHSSSEAVAILFGLADTNKELNQSAKERAKTMTISDAASEGIPSIGEPLAEKVTKISRLLITQEVTTLLPAVYLEMKKTYEKMFGKQTFNKEFNKIFTDNERKTLAQAMLKDQDAQQATTVIKALNDLGFNDATKIITDGLNTRASALDGSIIKNAYQAAAETLNS